MLLYLHCRSVCKRLKMKLLLIAAMVTALIGLTSAGKMGEEPCWSTLNLLPINDVNLWCLSVETFWCCKQHRTYTESARCCHCKAYIALPLVPLLTSTLYRYLQLPLVAPMRVTCSVSQMTPVQPLQSISLSFWTIRKDLECWRVVHSFPTALLCCIVWMAQTSLFLVNWS